jgi:putative nucleotidyltransferase with HDIG domain
MFTRRRIYLILLLLVTSGFTLLALLAPILSLTSSPQIKAGSVSTQDYSAPEAKTYVSDVLTQLKRDETASLVSPVYTPADPGIARQQLERLRATLDYTLDVRNDAYATNEQKRADLAALADIQLKQDTISLILALSDARWQTVSQESIAVLERVMGNTIRDDQIENARRSVPVQVSLSVPEDQADIVAELVVAFVIPNSLYNETATETAQQQAGDAIEPVTRSFAVGEIVVSRGQLLKDEDIEALQMLGLVTRQNRWREMDGAFILVGLMMVFFVLYLNRSPVLANDLRGLTLIAILFVAFLLGARLTIPGHTVLPYLYPLTAYSLVMMALFGLEPTLISSLPLAILTAYGLPNSLDLTLFYTLSSFFGILTLRRAQRVTSFFRAGLVIALSGAIVLFAFRLPQGMDWIGLATLGGTAVLNGIASASICILLQFFLAQFLGMTTALQLVELSRPDHPLMQFILRNAPGTYQHSLQVANLAEQAAEQIGADPLLTRVGSLYHDAGKAVNPGYFIENQLPGDPNPHDQLEPIVSAAEIIRHVTEGLALARKYRLPRRIKAFISEHHGDALTRYQYVRAVEAAGGDESRVDAEMFRYPGPRPQSRETALLMLADACEAKVRADRPKDERELKALIQNQIDQRMKSGQLDDTNLTLRDLAMIAESFTATLRGIYHPRIQYPQLQAKPSAVEISAPTTRPRSIHFPHKQP